MKKMLLIAVAFMLTACAQLGMQTPDTFGKRLLTAYATVDAVADGATQALAAKQINEVTAANIAKTGRTALTIIDAASALYEKDCPSMPVPGSTAGVIDPKCVSVGANGKLQEATTVLIGLQALLATYTGVK